MAAPISEITAQLRNALWSNDAESIAAAGRQIIQDAIARNELAGLTDDANYEDISEKYGGIIAALMTKASNDLVLRNLYILIDRGPNITGSSIDRVRR